MVYLKVHFQRDKQKRLFVKVISTASLNKSFNRLFLSRNKWFRGVYEVYPRKMGQTVYSLFDNKGEEIGKIYKSTSHYTWWKLKR